MLDQRQAIEDELREHIEKLERRQATDDASLLIVNRYWSQVAACPFTPCASACLALASSRSLNSYPSCLFTHVFFCSLMRTSASSLNAMIWTRVWETYSQKGKPWLCQNQNPTLIAIRSARMTVREASLCKHICHSISYLPGL